MKLLFNPLSCNGDQLKTTRAAATNCCFLAMHISEVFLLPMSSCGLCRGVFFHGTPFEARAKNTKNKRVHFREAPRKHRPLKRCRAICGEPRLILSRPVKSRETRICQTDADARATRFKVAISKVAQTLTKLGARLCQFLSLQFFFFR